MLPNKSHTCYIEQEGTFHVEVWKLAFPLVAEGSNAERKKKVHTAHLQIKDIHDNYLQQYMIKDICNSNLQQVAFTKRWSQGSLSPMNIYKISILEIVDVFFSK